MSEDRGSDFRRTADSKHKPPPLAVNPPVEVIVDDSFLFSPGVETPGHRLPNEKAKGGKEIQPRNSHLDHADSPVSKPGCALLPCVKKPVSK